MKLLGEEIVAIDQEDKMACQGAYEFSSESKPILPVPYNEPLFLDRASTKRVVQGLVCLSLEGLNHDHGLRSLDAILSLVDLYGVQEIARISLEDPSYTHETGLGQADAYMIIDRLYGTVEDPHVFQEPN